MIRKNASLMLTLLAMASFLLAGAPAFAHHGSAQSFDVSKTITLTGVVTNFAWINPHSHIYFDAKDPHGAILHWDCEMTSPGVLAGAGWSKHSLNPGDKITITVHPALSGEPVGLFRKIVFPNGAVFTAVNGGYPSRTTP